MSDISEFFTLGAAIGNEFPPRFGLVKHEPKKRNKYISYNYNPNKNKEGLQGRMV